MPLIETLILLFGICSYSGVAIADQHNQMVKAVNNCQNASEQIHEKK